MATVISLLSNALFFLLPSLLVTASLDALFFTKNSAGSCINCFSLNPKLKDYELLLTKRKADLLHHGGEISFPGGKKEVNDKTPVDTAIRETKEEIHLCAQYIHPIVTLPPLNTVSGYAVYPALAIVDQFL